MEHPKKIIAGSLLIVIFVLIVSITSWYVQNIIYSGDICSCAVPLPVLIQVLASIGMLVGTLVYYIFSPRFEKSPVEKDSVLKLLNETESKIVDTLINNNGELSQAKISSLTGLSKVKVFRSLEKLVSRDIVKKEKKGKTNVIRLAEDIMKMFK